MTTIYLGASSETLKDRDGTSVFRVCSAKIRVGWQRIPLQDCPAETFRNTRRIRLRAQLSRWRTRAIWAHPRVTRALVTFLREKHARDDLSYDCYAFATQASGLPPHPCTYLNAYWYLHELPDRLVPGDTLLFLDMVRQRFRHAALYVGHGLCVSVYGAGGDVEFSTVEDMRREFDAPHVFLAVPRAAP